MKYGIRSAEYLLKEKSQEDGYFPIVVYISRDDLVNKEMITKAKAKCNAKRYWLTSVRSDKPLLTIYHPIKP